MGVWNLAFLFAAFIGSCVGFTPWLRAKTHVLDRGCIGNRGQVCQPRISMRLDDPHYSRRALMFKGVIMFHSVRVAASEPRGDANRPLTQEEMEEYQKLLMQKQRIISVIESNKKAFEKEFETHTPIFNDKNGTTYTR